MLNKNTDKECNQLARDKQNMKNTPKLARPTWIEIDLSRLSSNIGEIKRFLGPGVKLLAVVKADAYGHGAYEISKAALQNGASMLGVASLDEGLYLRSRGIESPILILGYTDPAYNDLLIEHNLTPTILSLDSAYSLSREAEKRDRKVPVHVKLDTGMGRLGVSNIDEALLFVQNITSLPGIYVEGIYTHFASAEEEDSSYTIFQLNLFKAIIRACEENGIKIPVKHVANTAAALRITQAHFDMVRVGIGLYGYSPSGELGSSVNLHPVLSWKTKIIFLKQVAAGTPISYGRTYVAPEKTSIATVPLGYGDGFNRHLSNRGNLLVKGIRVPVIGSICMDLTMLDVGNVPSVKEGDECIIIGSQQGNSIFADEIARNLGTISYEVLCSINQRIPRFYYNGITSNQ